MLVVLLDSHFFYLKFRQSMQNPKRYRKEVICGYSVPLLFLIMTGIAESSLDQCSKYRPRFNEQSCFFSGIYDFKHWSKAFRILLTYVHAIVNTFFFIRYWIKEHLVLLAYWYCPSYQYGYICFDVQGSMRSGCTSQTTRNYLWTKA